MDLRRPARTAGREVPLKRYYAIIAAGVEVETAGASDFVLRIAVAKYFPGGTP
jgi:hypothetical protein